MNNLVPNENGKFELTLEDLEALACSAYVEAYGDAQIENGLVKEGSDALESWGSSTMKNSTLCIDIGQFKVTQELKRHQS